MLWEEWTLGKACADITCDAAVDVEYDDLRERDGKTGGWKGGKGGGLLFPAFGLERRGENEGWARGK